MNNYHEIVIAGPTASGKTACAVSVALALGGEILSADSRQVYRSLDIGTGKDLAEYKRGEEAVPYHLIDIADVRENYSLYRYCGDFAAALATVRTKKSLPVICGGTGLYVEAVLRGYRVSDVPEDAPLRKQLMGEDHESLLGRLAAYPRLYAATDLKSKKRVVRALEIASHKGDEPGDTGSSSPLENPLVVIISPPPELLRQRIAARLASRLENGMIEEVRALRDSGISDERLLMLGMEYGAILRYLNGSFSRDEMQEHLYGEICRLAKRQRTWFRGMERRGSRCLWLECGDAAAIIDALNLSRR